LDGVGEQPIEPVANDGVRLPAAHLHDHPRPRDLGRDALDQPAHERRVAILVEVLHVGSPAPDGRAESSPSASSSSPSSRKSANARAASSASRREMAKPTWTSTKSPGWASSW